MNTTATPARVREQKSFAFAIKEFDDANGIVRGYLSTFDNVDEGGDRVRPGAFKRTLQNKYEYKKANKKQYLMPVLWQHDTNNPIGGYTEAKEDNIGLYVELQLDLDIQKGREAYSGLKKGYIFQQSMGYDTIKADYVKVDGQTVRDLVEVRLWEGSIVTFPMNPEAVVTGVKNNTMNTQQQAEQQPKQKKTVQDHFNEEMAQDCLEDWSDVYLCSLSKAVFDAFTIGDEPASDISDALDAFKELVMSKFVPQAIESNLSQYISDTSYSYNPAANTLQNGSSDSYYDGYMSNSHSLARKANSKNTQSHIDNHIADLHDIADTATKAMKRAMSQIKAVHTAADDFATVIQGSEPAYGDGEGTPDPGQQEGKSASSTVTRRSKTTHSSTEDTVSEDELAAAMRTFKIIR